MRYSIRDSFIWKLILISLPASSWRFLLIFDLNIANPNQRFFNWKYLRSSISILYFKTLVSAYLFPWSNWSVYLSYILSAYLVYLTFLRRRCCEDFMFVLLGNILLQWTRFYWVIILISLFQFFIFLRFLNNFLK